MDPEDLDHCRVCGASREEWTRAVVTGMLAWDVNFADHFVIFDEDAWVVEHSLECRMSGEMQRGCEWQRSIQAIGDDMRGEPGRWRITGIDSEGLPSLERLP